MSIYVSFRRHVDPSDSAEGGAIYSWRNTLWSGEGVRNVFFFPELSCNFGRQRVASSQITRNITRKKDVVKRN